METAVKQAAQAVPVGKGGPVENEYLTSLAKLCASLVVRYK